MKQAFIAIVAAFMAVLTLTVGDTLPSLLPKKYSAKCVYVFTERSVARSCAANKRVADGASSQAAVAFRRQ